MIKRGGNVIYQIRENDITVRVDGISMLLTRLYRYTGFEAR